MSALLQFRSRLNGVSWRESLLYAFLWRMTLLLLLIGIYYAVGLRAAREEQQALHLWEKHFGAAPFSEDSLDPPVDSAHTKEIIALVEALGVMQGKPYPWEGGGSVVLDAILSPTEQITPFPVAVQEYVEAHRDVFVALNRAVQSEAPVFSSTYYYHALHYLYALYTLWAIQEGNHEQAALWHKTGNSLFQACRYNGEPWFQIMIAAYDYYRARLCLKIPQGEQDIANLGMPSEWVERYVAALWRDAHGVMRAARRRPARLVYYFLDHPAMSNEAHGVVRALGFVMRPYLRCEAAVLAQHECRHTLMLRQQLPCMYAPQALRDLREPIRQHRLGRNTNAEPVMRFQQSMLRLDAVQVIADIKKTYAEDGALPEVSLVVQSTLCETGAWRYERCSEDTFAITYIGTPLWEESEESIPWQAPCYEWTVLAQ